MSFYMNEMAKAILDREVELLKKSGEAGAGRSDAVKSLFNDAVAYRNHKAVV